MAIVTLRQESLDQAAFYTPRYEVRIEGVGLPRDVLRDVISLTYKDDVKTIDSFEMTVNNWDTTTGDFKYVGAETPADLTGNSEAATRYKLFEPCDKEAKVSMGYLDEMRVMVVGNFTTLEPNFPTSGAPTLTVRGLNVLHQLRRKQYSSDWSGKTDSQIAEDIATKVDKDTGKKRFPLPIETDPTSKADEPIIEFVSQNNEYDIDFLLARARLRGYVVFVQEADPEVRGSKKRLYFGRSESAQVPGLRDVTFELEWGKSLIDFKPTLTTANQFKSVTVTGWNRRTAKAIKEKVSLSDAKLNFNKDLYRLLEKCDPRDEVIHKPVFNEKEAKALARGTLSDRLKDMVKCSGTTVGLPDLRAGRTVRILGVGARFSGVYFITDTQHTINDSGYVTKFNARREDPGTGLS